MTHTTTGIGALAKDRNEELWLRGIDGDWINRCLTEEWSTGELAARVGPLTFLSCGVNADGTPAAALRLH